MYDHPMQYTCHPAEATPMQEVKKAADCLHYEVVGNPTPSDQFDMLPSTEYKTFLWLYQFF